MDSTRPGFRRPSTTTLGAEHAFRFGSPSAWPARLAAGLALWYQRWRQRRCLAELEDRLLQDIGKTRKEALEEAGKPFWQP